MRIMFTRPSKLNGRDHVAGHVIELDGKDAAPLIKDGFAVEAPCWHLTAFPESVQPEPVVTDATPPAEPVATDPTK